MGLLDYFFTPKIDRLIKNNDRAGLLRAMRSSSFWTEQTPIKEIIQVGVTPAEIVSALVRLLETTSPTDLFSLHALIRNLSEMKAYATSAVRPILKTMSRVADSMVDPAVSELDSRYYGYSSGSDRITQGAAMYAIAGLLYDRFSRQASKILGRAAAMLATMGDASLKEVVRCLSDPDKTISLQAVRVLRLFAHNESSRQAEPALLELLEDPDKRTRREVLITIGFIRRSARNIDSAMEACLMDPDPRISSHCLRDFS